jgi:hypothetical protein
MDIFTFYGASGSVDSWGTVLQAGRSRVPLTLGSLYIPVDLILPADYGPGVYSASNRKEYQESLLGVKDGRWARKADNHSAIYEPIV